MRSRKCLEAGDLGFYEMHRAHVGSLRARHSETPPGENQNLFARLTVRTYVWIVPDWTLQQSMAKRTERQVQQIAYQGKL